MTISDILEYPLPLAFFIYLTLCTIILYVKPNFLFTSSSTSDSEANTEKSEIYANKNIWLVFIILAIVVYTLVSLLVSQSNRNNYLEKMKTLI